MEEKAVENVNFAAGKKIYTFGSDTNYGGVMISGKAYLESTDRDGNRRIIDVYESGDVFVGESFPVSSMENVRIVAKAACAVRFFKDAKSAEGHMEKSGKTFMRSSRRLMAHVRILGERSLRQKIIAFIEYEGRDTKENRIRISMSYSDMADFISADRSAMMRELKSMSDEGIIKRDGRMIEVVD